MSKRWLFGKEKDVKSKLADKLLDGIITFEEKELIACYLETKSAMESALKILVDKLYRKEILTSMEKELISDLSKKNGKGRPKGTDPHNRFLAVTFKMIRSEFKTDIEARDSMRKDAEIGLTDETLRKRIEAGERSIAERGTKQIAESIKYNYDKEIISRALMEIK